MSIPSIFPGSKIVHALNLWVDVPEGWRNMTPAELQMDAVPVFPAGWRCGFPFSFVAKLPVQEWIDAGLPSMNEKGWTGYLKMIAESQGPAWSPKKKKAIEELLECAQSLYAAWDKIQ